MGHKRGVRAIKVHGDWAASCSKDSLHLWSMERVMASVPTTAFMGKEPAHVDVRPPPFLLELSLLMLSWQTDSPRHTWRVCVCVLFLLLDSGHVAGLFTFCSHTRYAHPPTREWSKLALTSRKRGPGQQLSASLNRAH